MHLRSLLICSLLLLPGASAADEATLADCLMTVEAIDDELTRVALPPLPDQKVTQLLSEAVRLCEGGEAEKGMALLTQASRLLERHATPR